MKVVILAGGYGTRISEETHSIPKPLIKIGEHPILWHIMKIYSSYGFNDFIVCLGYKGHMIKDYFINYFIQHADFTINLTDEKGPVIHKHFAEPWKITLVDTGLDTLTGGRIKKIQEYVGNQPFFLTYGDGVADINIKKLLDFHTAHGKAVTVTAVQPEGRFGMLEISDSHHVIKMQEKIQGDGRWVSGGFFVCQPQIFDYINGDETIFEREPLESISTSGELMAYRHNGFWQPMDTLKEKKELEQIWKEGKAPWKIWAS